MSTNLPALAGAFSRSTSAARHHYHHGTSHHLRMAEEVRSQASCSRTACTSAYTFAVRSDHPPSPHILQPCRYFLNPVSFCTKQVTTKPHSGEAATSGEGGVNRTVARKSSRAAPAGSHHGGPRGATRRSQPYSPGGGAAPTLRPAAFQMTATKRISGVLFPRGFEVASPRRSLQLSR